MGRALRDIEAGLVDADLGHGLVKQRVARKGKGKSGGYRTIIAYRSRTRAVFLFGFAKSDKADLEPDEKSRLVRIGQYWLGVDDEVIEQGLDDHEIVEIELDDEAEG